MERGFALEDTDVTLTRLDELWADDSVRMNEATVTTSREGLEVGDDQAAGSLFEVAPGVSGLPVREFAG